MLILLVRIETWCYFTYSPPVIKSRLLGRGARSNSCFCCLFAAFLRFAGHTMPSEGDPLWRSLLPLCQRCCPAPAAPFAPGGESSSKTSPGPHFSPLKKVTLLAVRRRYRPLHLRALTHRGSRTPSRRRAHALGSAFVPAPRREPPRAEPREVFGGCSEGLPGPCRAGRGAGSAGSGPREP